MNSVNKVKNNILNAVYILLPALAVIWMCEFGNEKYQTTKDIASAKAVLALMLLIFILKRVQLFNWVSFAFSILLIPAYYLYRNQFIDSQDILKAIDINIWTQWLALMIIIDFIRTFKRDKKYYQNLSLPSLIFYGVTFVCLYICRNGRREILAFLFPILLYALVPMKEEEQQKMAYRFSEAWAISFLYVLITSIMNAKYDEGRFLGSFEYLGFAALYYGGVFAAFAFRATDTKIKVGRKNKKYALSIALMIVLSIVLLFMNTRTVYLGIATYLIFWFIFMSTDDTKETRRKRSLICLACSLAIASVGAAFALFCKYSDVSYWRKHRFDGGLVGYWGTIVNRFASISDAESVYDADIFQPGTIMGALDNYSSGRLSVYKLYLEKVKFFGCVGEGVQVGSFFSNNTHSTYLNLIYFYGILGGTVLLAWIGYSIVVMTKRWKKYKKTDVLLALSFLAMSLGLMATEMQTFYFPTFFATLLFLRPMFYKETIVEADEDEFLPEEEMVYVFIEEE